MKTKDVKRKNAKAVLDARLQRSDEEQLCRLNAHGYVARKERSRLCRNLGISLDESWWF